MPIFIVSVVLIFQTERAWQLGVEADHNKVVQGEGRQRVADADAEAPPPAAAGVPAHPPVPLRPGLWGSSSALSLEFL